MRVGRVGQGGTARPACRSAAWAVAGTGAGADHGGAVERIVVVPVESGNGGRRVPFRDRR
ncbi:hypothetical protein SNE510_13870 [Streptomyces sp. NE5-10]|uniref:Uncharacterized protein n=1 Tax=Streptomyces hydrogenans TaxID=1873719 RepID=A0ABQ3PFZ9_9ACTN|nr:hypothetical protein GCM10018784_27230 [Streptomyces hydrogenans]GHI23949.1 hypothetical protein Shyd_53200 [Streptomyces hydrogenans]GHJ91868.1 hypothetical protein SNE510_13870 [Streptomyces sp. NE5-10]